MSNAAALAPIIAALRLPPTERPTAIFAWYDGVALRIMEIARELGLRIPEDLSLIGFDGTDMGVNTSPPLTTMRQPIVEIASHAITQVAQCLRGESVSVSRTLFTPELIPRASCAPLS